MLQVTGVAVDKDVAPVSILTGPGGPVLPPRGIPDRTLPVRFNPHRARRPGATGSGRWRASTPMTFQSSPGPEARCYYRLPLRR